MIVYHELSSIETDLGFSAKTLYGLSNNPSRHYRAVEIPKSNGGTRRLFVPDEALKGVQRAIAERLLSLEPISVYATAYRPASSILVNARPHIRKGKILKLDIHGFFDSINYSVVKDRAFPAERYSESIRILLTMLCYYRDVLPQGAPTSPAISNIVLYEFDNIVGEYCGSKGVSYTRYCDDMTFSGNDLDAESLIAFVESQLRKNGLLLNKRKTKCFNSSKRQSVTGIVVNEKPNISEDYKREIRKEAYYLQKFGVESHLNRTGADIEPCSYLTSLLGKINFVLQVCPNDNNFKRYKLQVLDALRRRRENTLA